MWGDDRATPRRDEPRPHECYCAQLLIVRRTGDDENVTDVWSVDVDGSNLYQVTHEPAGYGAFWFTPAGV
jgi:hypothetical protein